MGLLEFFNKFIKNKNNKKYATSFNGYNSSFPQFGNSIYASDVVQQAISCIVFEMKKLRPLHIRMNGFDSIPVSNSQLQKLLDEPNERMTMSEFIEKVYWQLFLNYNSFIVPTYTISSEGEKTYTGLYPIQPITVEFLQDLTGKLFVKFKFVNGYETILKYTDVIHLKYKFSINEFMGGDNSGQPDNKALLKTLELNNTLLEGLSKALKSSYSINGVIKYNTLLDNGKMEQNIKELEERIRNSESGFLPLDIKGEFIPLQNKVQLIDEKTLKFVDEKILRTFGVPLPILLGDFTAEQLSAFYQKTLEPLIIGLSQAFTKVLFTTREKGFGNKIQFYPNELIFMNTDQKLNLFNLLIDSASCYKNETRTAFGLAPLPELAGQIAMSSNKTNAENNKTKKLAENNVDDDNVNSDLEGKNEKENTKK